MKFEIISDKENNLLSRREIYLRVFSEATPKREDIKNLVVANFDAKPELVVIDKIKQEFGKNESIVYVKIYNSQEVLKRLEKIPRKLCISGGEDAKKA